MAHASEPNSDDKFLAANALAYSSDLNGSIG
jgi:hypothetical protein